MYTKFTFKFLVLLLAGIVLISLAIAQPGLAQTGEEPEQPKSVCLTCHEDLYYNYDTGKWFCLCELAPSCTDCHGGDPAALRKEAAHLGMNPYPTLAETPSCMCCHGEEYEARIETFASIAGIDQHHPPIPTPTVSQGMPAPITPVPPAEDGQMRMLQLTLTAGLLLLILFAILGLQILQNRKNSLA